MITTIKYTNPVQHSATVYITGARYCDGRFTGYIYHYGNHPPMLYTSVNATMVYKT